MTDNSLDFSELEFQLSFGEVDYNPEVLEKFIAANLDALSDLEPGHLIGKIAEWYGEHLSRGGDRNEAMDHIIEEATHHLIN